MELNIPLLLYAVVQFVAFIFVLVATPIGIFRVTKNHTIAHGVISLWGAKVDTGNSTLFDPISDFWSECPGHLLRFRLAEAFAIISIFVYGAAFVLGVIMLFCGSILRWICLGLNIVGAITVCIVWATMVRSYFNDDGKECPALQSVTVYGAGFALFVAAWVLDVINIFILLLSICTTVTTESGQVKQTEVKL
ncbi:amastin-like surface protein, putative [Leishmania panamensis]|uniref:Amastin-like surface protein, putative n=1 Tax=Leishmania panamensis TaxID=5679 RepID=A0A088RNG4_LEIPA|nr:amastin-like surface protein, putative [Leishmania panamensis]AIN97602.1 amastin-like surface protein, putative [Leishmania panamensis]